MNQYIFSAKNNEIIPISLKELYVFAETWPDDAAEIPDDVAFEFLSPVPAGKMRSVGDGGLPCWVDLPALTQDQKIAIAEQDKKRRINVANDYMNSRQWPGKAAIGRLKGDELASYNSWLDYLEELEALDTSSGLNPSWPEDPSR